MAWNGKLCIFHTLPFPFTLNVFPSCSSHHEKHQPEKVSKVCQQVSALCHVMILECGERTKQGGFSMSASLLDKKRERWMREREGEAKTPTLALVRYLTKIATLTVWFCERYILLIFCPLSPMGAKTSSQAAAQHKQGAMLTQCSPSVCRLAPNEALSRGRLRTTASIFSLPLPPSGFLSPS